MTTKHLNGTIYRETIEDLRAKMESQYGSVSKFCDTHGMCKFNMYKIFSKTGKSQEMSVGMFARVMAAFGVKELEAVSSSQLSLKSYLEIDNNAILKGIMAIKFS